MEANNLDEFDPGSAVRSAGILTTKCDPKCTLHWRAEGAALNPETCDPGAQVHVRHLQPQPLRAGRGEPTTGVHAVTIFR